MVVGIRLIFVTGTVESRQVLTFITQLQLERHLPHPSHIFPTSFLELSMIRYFTSGTYCT